MAISYFEFWKKFEEYSLKEHKEKGLYIRPESRDAVEYNPFEQSTEILFTILTLG